MKRQWVFALGLLSALALAGSVTAAIESENILLPLSAGFKMGSHQENPKKMMSEFVPSDESVDHWSRMITEIILRDQTTTDPEIYQSAMLSDWKRACPGGGGRPLSNVKENGYAASYWSFNCPLNPATKLGRSMVRKIIVAKDAVYDVQVAYRKADTAELSQAAITYLRGVTVCDTRTREHPCPSGLEPVKRSQEPAQNPVATFLRAADVNDFAAMETVLDQSSADFLKQIRNCYLRRVYTIEQPHELIAAWMCSEGPNRSRVILADIVAASGNKVSVKVVQDTTNDRPAPERDGSAFAK